MGGAGGISECGAAAQETNEVPAVRQGVLRLTAGPQRDMGWFGKGPTQKG